MRNINKASSSTKLATLLIGAAMLGLGSQGAWAQAGDTISNLAKISYSVGAIAQEEICSSPAGNGTGNGGTTGTTCTDGVNGAGNSSFVVDNRVDVVVAGGIATVVTPGQTSVVTPFTVTNNGNSTLDFSLVAANAATALAYDINGTPIDDNFDPVTALTIYSDGGVLGIIDGADAVITSIANLAAGATQNLLVLTDIPGTQVNGDAAVVSMQATAVWPNPLIPAESSAAAVAGGVVATTAGADTAGVDVVLADAAGGTTGLPADAASDGVHSNYGAYDVAAAVLSVQKVATLLCDPINGDTNPKNIPGAAIQYAVTITNAAGSAAANLSTVTDTLVAALAFNTDLISGVGVGANCVTGTGSLSASGFGAVSGAGIVTSYASPGLAGEAVTAGATHAAGLVTIGFTTLASPTYGLVAGSLPANSYVTVYFNAFVQ